MTVTADRRDGSIAYVTLLTLAAALGGLLFGYDTAVISGAIGFLQVHFQLDPQVSKGWAAACALLGCAAGAGLAGLLSDRFGRKRMLVLAAVLFLVSSVGTAYPPGFAGFVIFRIMAGLGVGAASITSPMYIAEVTPARIRGRMVSINQFAIVSGFIVVYFANYLIESYGTLHVDRARIAATATLTAGEQAKSLRVFIADTAKISDRKIKAEAVDAFLAAQKGNIRPAEVVAFLKDNSVTAKETGVELACRGLVSWNVRYGWRWMFGAGILPSSLFLLLLLLVPESPRWLVKQERQGEALRILSRVGGARHAQSELAEIQAALAQETGSIAQLFTPGMRMVLVIGVVLAVLQQVTGVNVFKYYAPEIFKKLGSDTSAALLQTVLIGVVDMVFTVFAIWSVDRLGRKPLMIVGSIGMAVCLVAMGAASSHVESSLLVQRLVLACILGYTACFAMSVGPVTWVILSEIFPTGIRGRAMAIATVCLWAANYVVIQTFTVMDESPWLIARFHHAFPFWLYAAFCVISVVFLWRFVPETKGKTLEEIERGWLRGKG